MSKSSSEFLSLHRLFFFVGTSLACTLLACVILTAGGSVQAEPVLDPLVDSPLRIDRLESRWAAIKESNTVAVVRDFEGKLLYAERYFRQLGRGQLEMARLGALQRAVRQVLVPEPELPMLAKAALAVPIRVNPPLKVQGSDDCQEAPLVAFGSFLGTTVGSTRDEVASCSPLGAAGDVWYRVRLEAGETLFASTAGSNFDTVLSVHELCPPPGLSSSLELACDDNGGPGQTSAISWGPSFASSERWIRVSGALLAEGDYQLTVAPGGRLEGRVLDEAGSPLENVSARLYGDSTFFFAIASTDADGHFAFTDLPADSYRLSTGSLIGYRDELFADIPCLPSDLCLPEAGDPIALALGETVDVGEIRLALGGTIEGRVMDSSTGESIEDSVVTVWHVASLSARNAFVDANGFFQISGLPAGEFVVQAESFGEYQEQAWPGFDCPRGCTLDDGTPVVLALGETVADIDFSLSKLGEVTGAVRFEDGTPQPIQPVELFDGAEERVAQTFSDTEGVYAFSNVPPGRYSAVAGNEANSVFVPELYFDVPCTATATGRCDFARAAPIEVTLEESTDGIDFTLSRGGQISGRIVDGVSGSPVAAAKVEVTPADGGPPKTTFASADGFYVLSGLAGGDYFIRARAPGPDHFDLVYPEIPCLPTCPLEEATPIAVAFEEQRTGVDFGLPRSGVLRGRVTAASTGLPILGVLVELVGGGATYSGATGADGRFEIVGLLPGDYALSTVAAGFIDVERELSFALNEAIEAFDLVLEAGGRIAGRVSRRGGAALGSTILVWDQDGVVKSALTAGGDYEIGGLAAGEYFVVSIPQDAMTWVPQVFSEIQCPTASLEDCPGGQSVVVAGVETVAGVDFVHDFYGEILGSVTSAVSGLEVPAVVEMYDSSGQLVGSTMTSFNGIYGFSQVSSGTYYFIARPIESSYGYMARVFGGEHCVGEACDPLSGTPLSVDYGDTASPNFVLGRGGSLSGRFEDRGGQPLTGGQLSIDLFDAEGRFLRTKFVSDERWFVSSLPAGSYRLVARDAEGRDFYDQVWQGGSCVGVGCDPRTGTLIPLGDGENRGGLDFSIDPVEPTTGRVFVTETGSPIADVTIQRWSLSGELLEQTKTGADGRYALSFRGSSYLSVSSSQWQDRVWPSVVCPNGDCRAVLTQGEVLSPAPDLSLSKIDFSLAEALQCGSATALCTLDRFQIETRWQTESAQGQGGAVPLTVESGYFWFFDPANVEVVIKTLDACDGFDHFWVFMTGLTNVEVEVSVLDTWTGATKVYRHQPGDLFQPIFDTTAFSTCSVPGPALGEVERSYPAPELASAGDSVEALVGLDIACTPTEEAACLNDGRFRAEGTFRVPGGETSPAKAVRLTSDTAYFWFFDEDNIEIVLKVLNACDGFDRHWVFAAGLTNVEVELKVTDTLTGAVWTYENGQGADFQPVADTETLFCP